MECRHAMTFVQLLKPIEPRPTWWQATILGRPKYSLFVLWLCRDCGKKLSPTFDVME